MWNNNQNQNQNQNRDVSVNSSLMISTSPDSLFTVSAWNRQLSVRFARAIGTRSDGSVEYETDRSRVISTAITYDNAVVLYEGYENLLKPAIEHKEPKTISILITGKDGAKKMLTVGYDPSKGSFVSISMRLNENNAATPDNVFTHYFNRRELREDYNFMSGESVSTVELETDLTKFMQMIHSIVLLTPIVNHGIRYDNSERARFANNRNVGNYAQYGGPQGYQNYSNQQQYAPNAFMPQQAQPLSGDSIDEELPFN